MMKSQSTVPIILGLSLLSVGGACVYAFLKKKKDDFADSSDFFTGNASSSTTTSDEADSGLSNKIARLVRMISKEELKSVEMTLSNKIVPLVVGRKGYTLRHIQDSTKTEIHLRELDESHQVCTIHGTEAGIQAAEQLIMKEASRQITLTEEMLVPQTACGKILGRCGDALQEICRKSMAKVWIEGTRVLGENRRIMITGTQDQINVARSLIEQKVKDDADFRRSQEQLDIRREPRIRTPPSSMTATPVPREVLPPAAEKLKSLSSSGQLEVFVSAVVSPSRFYLQLVGPQSTELDILVETMTEYYNQQDNRDLHKIRKPYLGQIVAAEFNADGKWYRAEVVAILPNEYKPGEIVLDLYFVDYGDNQYIQPAEVYELRPDFLALRFQAIECFLAHVQPNTGAVSSTTGEEDWEPAAISRFEELTHVAQWKKLLSRIATYKNKGHRVCAGAGREGREGSPVPGVELYDTAADGTDVNIAVELVNEGHAKVIMNFGDLDRSHVLRLDGETEPSSTTSPDKVASQEKTNGTARSVSEVKKISVDVPVKSEDPEEKSQLLLQAEQANSVEKRENVNSTTVSENNNGKLNGNGLLSRDWNELVEEEERRNPTLTH
uniref:Putative kinase anchor protein n=1 Tax=Culex tarsalis TaxID=7177 RepID=A0A1Q3FJE6_CULTA